ncbi:acyltransferase [Bradyrhizobium centrosematis]|uniref:acyltransferase n=1 Tax=Bradyrhizobium centrosematis TaxID=1300039 RepID=UPI002169296E|nr:acyltransferase [Bradyrhizobium centrosematis]MCS3765326.1 UDP-2-acetamido-3-amino-2,3-dideoxy-glucuronate N-acetyltransferase [Bradyrhizobium centrosematis]MCS3773974.1 UDP-2-acetamido-3-amino-2,3-dideoxy-glucuronate N-acetyltransferase [Bradyrhizobium centrosematis]
MHDATVLIHPSAFVDPGATVGAYTSIWHFSHLEAGAVVGENNNLGQNTYIGNNAVVGNGCRLGNSVSVFSHVELGDFVFCAPFMVFTHIAFPRAAVSRRDVFEKTLVGTGATLGANSTVVPGVTVGTGSFLGGGSVLTRSAKDWSLMIGAPARQRGWVSAFGEKIDLPLIGSGEWRCPHTDDVYILQGDLLSRRPGPKDILRYIPGMKLERMQAAAR